MDRLTGLFGPPPSLLRTVQGTAIFFDTARVLAIGCSVLSYGNTCISMRHLQIMSEAYHYGCHIAGLSMPLNFFYRLCWLATCMLTNAHSLSQPPTTGKRPRCSTAVGQTLGGAHHQHARAREGSG